MSEDDTIKKFPVQRTKSWREFCERQTEINQKKFDMVNNYVRKHNGGNDPDPWDREYHEFSLEEAWLRLNALEGLALGTRTMDESEIKGVQAFAADSGMPTEPMPEAAIRYYIHDIEMMLGEAFLALAIANDEADGKT